MKPRAAAILLLCATSASAQTNRQNFAQIERGKYLTTVGDCEACHNTPNGARFAGGRPIETPFGKILASNITPDRETGIGALTDPQFVDVLQHGRGRGGMRLYPAMPFTYTTRVTQQDALAIRAYLATIPAMRHRVVENQLPFPLDIRFGMVFWDALFFHSGSFKPDPAKSPEWNRGAYLVTGLEHCGMCHTPKNLLGGDETSRALQGYTVQGWFAPELSPDPRRGLGAWSIGDIVAYLRTGHNRFAAASGPMAEEVAVSSQHDTLSDLHDIAIYLKDPPATQPPQTPASQPDPKILHEGAAIYSQLCSACHTPNGAGIPGLFPSLAGNPAVQSRDPTSTIRVVLRGAHTVATKGAPTGPGMPSFAWTMSNAQVAAITTYVRNAWGNNAPIVSESKVEAERQSLAARTNDPD